MGLPKFWEAVGRETGRPGLNSRLMTHLIRRVQYMVGYPKHTRELIDKDGDGVVLTELDNYGFGTVRSREDFLKLTQIDVANYRCNKMKWCDEGEIE